MSGDENLPQWAQDEIIKYTEQYNNAITDFERNNAHEGAESIRRRVHAVDIALYYDEKNYYENGFHYYDGNINVSDGSDCTNYVSICLNGAGISMNEEWYWNSYTTGGLRGIVGRSTTDASSSWLNPDPFYRYFSQVNNSNGIGFIPNGSDLKFVPEGVLPGDVIAFNNFADGPQGYINHLGIVTSIQTDGIHYSGHSNTREDASLYIEQNGFNGDIYIIKMRY